MIKRNISKLLIFLMTTSLGVVKAYGYAEVGQPIETGVQPAVSIVKADGLCVENGSINPENGIHTGLSSVFELQTNGTDKDYDFVIKAEIMTEAGPVSAYANDGSILFGHTFVMPLQSDIDDAKTGGKNNKNVIAYPVSVSIAPLSAENTQAMTVDFQKGYGTVGDCYVVNLNNAPDARVTHRIDTTPIAGTYNIGQDQDGSYQTVVTLTTVSK